MMTTEHFHTGMGYHTLCRKLSVEQSLPEAFVCYLLFEKIYEQDTLRAIVFFIESELAGFLYKVKGPFELIPVDGQEWVQFEDGTSVGHNGATMTWKQFFQLVYMGCTRECLEYIDDLLTEYLHRQEITEKQISATRH